MPYNSLFVFGSYIHGYDGLYFPITIYMRIEIVLILVSTFLMANIYTDGKILKKALSLKKYYQMAGIFFAALFVYYLLKKNPLKTKEILLASNEYVKYLPIDKNTSNMILPILDFTTKSNFYGDGITKNYPITSVTNNIIQPMNQPVKATKRSVSETKKKFVAARQNWKCGDCHKQLTASFEVDHIVRLEHGGSNHQDNLVALCRQCHGDKTTIENL
jgi:5-methylcytosine-specific restriction endonuclease McrA